MRRSFHDTLNLNTDRLKEATARAIAQEDLVQELFAANPAAKLSPSMVMDLVSKKYKRHCPITSWRRAITNMTNIGVLKKLEEKTDGLFGMPEHLWQYNKPKASDAELQSFLTELQSEGAEGYQQGSLF